MAPLLLTVRESVWGHEEVKAGCSPPMTNNGHVILCSTKVLQKWENYILSVVHDHLLERISQKDAHVHEEKH